MLQVIDKSLSGSCKSAGTCASGRDLRVLNQSNGAPPLHLPTRAASQAACFQLAARAFDQVAISISREWAGHTYGTLGLTLVRQYGLGTWVSCRHGRDTCGAGQDLGRDPVALIAAFYEEYRHDKEMQEVDAFVCSHPAAMCELFEPFNKSLLVYATTRYEMARCFSDAAMQGNVRLPCAHGAVRLPCIWCICLS